MRVSMMLALLSMRHSAPTPAMIAAVASGVKKGSTAVSRCNYFIEGGRQGSG